MKFFKNIINNIKMNIFERYLSNFIDAFKTKNPKIFAGVAILLVAIKAGLESVFASQLIPDEAINSILEWVVFIVAIVVGAHTPQEENDAGSKSE